VIAHAARLTAILQADSDRQRLLAHVRALDLPDCWIGAGFARDAVWDALHNRPPTIPSGDIDVIWFNKSCIDKAADDAIETRLRTLEPTFAWSVKNQARMHARNNDPPYASSIDAIRFWPETATAIAVRLQQNNQIEVAAPLGLDDLFHLIVRPTARFADEKRPVFQERVRTKRWLEKWPSLKLANPSKGRHSHK